MKKYVVVLAVAGVLVLGFLVAIFALEGVWEDIGRPNRDVNTVLVGPDSRLIYIGSEKGIFKSEDAGQSWRNILSIRGTNRKVNFLLFALGDNNSLYAATGNGLYYSRNRGEDWNRIFKGKNYLENECTTLAVLPSTIYLGTKAGLFVSTDKGRSWYKETAKLGNSHILAIAHSLKEPNYLYVACMDGVFKSKDSGRSWERIFIASSTENDSNKEEASDDQDVQMRISNVRYITVDPNNANYLYLATSSGIYKSQDKGGNWKLLSSFGLLNRDVRFLLVSSGSYLYAVTKSGVFEYMDNRWQELSLGLIAADIRFLAQDNQDNLYAACDKGLFRMRAEKFNHGKTDNIIALYYKDEPAINEIHQAAIKYAGVIDPLKIDNLRKQARLKAILPELKIDYDRTVTSYSNTTMTRYTTGPADWSVSLKWNLSELIWSEQQRLIDSQVRLMVQLRDDILDEVTKLYFERLRVKMELDNLSIEDRKKRFEKELRLQELTASIDALTGGYFSQQFKKN